VLSRLQRDRSRRSLRQLAVTAGLMKIVKAFERRGIDVVPYKGLVLAASVYGDVTLRQSLDVDLLVRKRDYRRGRDVLVAEGYRLAHEYEWESTFVDTTGRVVVDLHRGLVPHRFPCSLTFDRVRTRLEPIQLGIGGRVIRSLSATDVLLVLCIQVAKDSWDRRFRLQKACDIAEWVRTHGDVDWAALLAYAGRLGCLRIVLFGLRLAELLIDIALPAAVSRALASEPAATALAEDVKSGFLAGTYDHDHVWDTPHALEFHWKIRERFIDRAVPYLFHAVIPNPKDRAVVALPPQWSFLYYVIRPVRVARDRGVQLLRQKVAS
jgi:hypothetical protein